jgi:DNA-binding transcriptional ArsR family regulator
MAHFDGETALRALADPRRRQMLELAWDHERSPSDLARRCQLSRPATSQHLKVLREAGLVSVRLEGNRRFYRAQTGRLAELRAMLDEFWGRRLARLHAELSACGEETDRD